MNYAKINKALAKMFGEGEVELRQSPSGKWDYELWFLEDNPSENTILLAKKTVNKVEPTLWLDEKAFHTDT